MKLLKNIFLIDIILCLKPDLPPSPSDGFILSEASNQQPPLQIDFFDLIQNFHDIAKNYQECVVELVQDRIKSFLGKMFQRL